jgi:hypothetical protein
MLYLIERIIQVITRGTHYEYEKALHLITILVLKVNVYTTKLIAAYKIYINLMFQL